MIARRVELYTSSVPVDVLARDEEQYNFLLQDIFLETWLVGVKKTTELPSRENMIPGIYAVPIDGIPERSNSDAGPISPYPLLIER